MLQPIFERWADYVDTLPVDERALLQVPSMLVRACASTHARRMRVTPKRFGRKGDTWTFVSAGEIPFQTRAVPRW